MMNPWTVGKGGNNLISQRLIVLSLLEARVSTSSSFTVLPACFYCTVNIF